MALTLWHLSKFHAFVNTLSSTFPSVPLTPDALPRVEQLLQLLSELLINIHRRQMEFM